MKKRLAAIFLTLALFSALITPAFALDLPDVPDPTLLDFSQIKIHDPQGGSYTLEANDASVTVLVVGRVTCGYTTGAFNSTLDVFDEFGIENGSIYYMDMDSSRSTVQSAMSDAPSNTHVAWSNSSDDYNDLFWLAVIASNGHVDSATLPAVFVLDENLQCIYYATYDTFDLNAYRAALSAYSNAVSEDSIYDTPDEVVDIQLNTAMLDDVTDASSALEAVEWLGAVMTTAQKQNPGFVDLAALYTENAAARAANQELSANEIEVSASSVADLAEISAQVNQEAESILSEARITTTRALSRMVTLTTTSTDEITIRVDPDILTAGVDKVRVEAPDFAIVLDMADLEEDLTDTLVFTAQSVGSGYGGATKKVTVDIKLPNGSTTNPITVAMATEADRGTYYQAMVNTDGEASASKYNPVTTKIEGKINTSGKYTVTTNEVNFSDISGKSAEMQRAIRYLASKGIINGTTPTTFSPEGSISRAEIAALIVRALGWNDSASASTFSDVTRSNWFYSAAASSQKRGLINGYPDNTFQGTKTISKEQIMAVSSRVLVNKMGYKIPANPGGYLTRYKDGVTNWARGEVALATKENLVVYRVDGTFRGAGNMTRGDAAIVVYRLFQKIW